MVPSDYELIRKWSESPLTFELRRFDPTDFTAYLQLATNIYSERNNGGIFHCCVIVIIDHRRYKGIYGSH